MINEANLAKYEKYVHEVELGQFRQNGGVDYLSGYVKQRVGANVIQDIYSWKTWFGNHGQYIDGDLS